jgi:hypothetical protein
MAARSVRAFVIGVLAICCLARQDGRLAAADPPTANGKAPLKGELVPQPESPQPGSPGPATAPLPGNDLGLLAAPSEATGKGAVRSESEGVFNGDGLCGPPGRFWLRGEYLVFWTSGTHLPRLVTQSPPNTPVNQAGVLGQPGTEVLFGDSTVNNQGRSGARVRGGFWLDCAKTWALEGDYFDLGGMSTNFTAASNPNGLPILARPFFDVNPVVAPPRQAAELVSFNAAGVPQVAGSVRVNAADYFQSAGMSIRHSLLCTEQCCIDADGEDARRLRYCGPTCSRLDLVAGYRYYRLNDNVTIHEQLEALNIVALFDVLDDFRARNDFHGAELGLSLQTYRGPWSLEMLMAMALGNNHQTVEINGFTTAAAGVNVQQSVGGAYALDSNIGNYFRNDFTIVPRLQLEAGYQLTSHLRAFAGYNLLYWGTVARAADQIDQNVDSARFPNSGRVPTLPYPAFGFHETSFWAQGINTGLELRY